jgi:hypothetical protein
MMSGTSDRVLSHLLCTTCCAALLSYDLEDNMKSSIILHGS